MLDPTGGPISGAKNWSSGYMPATYQGTILRSAGAPVLDLGRPAGMSEPAHRRLVVGDRGLRQLPQLPEMGVGECQLGPGLTGLIGLGGRGGLRLRDVGGARPVDPVGVCRPGAQPERASDSEHSGNPSTGSAHATTPSGSRARSRPNRANLMSHRSNRAI